MSDNAWLRDLKAGDTVIVDRDRWRVAKVARVTATMIVLDNGGRFRRSDGFIVGGDQWTTGLLREATPGRIAAIREREENRKHLDYLRGANWSCLPAELVKRVYDLIRASETPKEGT